MTNGSKAETTRNSNGQSKTNGEAVNGSFQKRDSVSEKDVELENECKNQSDLRVPPQDEFGLGALKFRQAMRRVANEYLHYTERVARGQEEIRARVKPGYLRPLLPTQPPEDPTSLDALIADFEKHLLPGVRLSLPSY